MCKDALWQTCSIMLLFPLLLRNALVQYLEDVQYGAYLSAVCRLLKCAKMHCGLVVAMGVVSAVYKKSAPEICENRSTLFD